MKSAFFKVILAVLLVLEPAKAMVEDEESSKHTSMMLSQQKKSEEKNLPSDIATIESLPDDMLLYVFKFVEIPDLGRLSQVSTRWKRTIETPELWKFMGSRYYGDYLSEENLGENPKQKVTSHFLSVIVNTTENLKEIERLARHYRLDFYVPLFKKYLGPSFLTDLVTNIPAQKEFIAQGNREIIKRFMGERMIPRELAEFLVEKGNSEAIQRKLEGLEEGKYGYEKNPLAARELNELLVKEGDLKAIERKINGLLFGNFGYETNWIEARKFNDLLVEKENLEAIQRKIRGLNEGKYGYEKNPLATRELNELLVKERDLKAIKRKLEGLIFGTFGYEADWIKVREFNELLVDEGNAEAIKRKEWGYSFYVTIEEEDEVTSKHRICGACHREDNSIAQKFNEFFVAQGDPVALLRKVWGLKNGTYGYKRDPLAVATVLEPLVEKGNPEAIQMKLEGLLKGEYGYKKDLVTARELNDLLVEKGNVEAIQRKIDGLIEGKYGYEKNPFAAVELNELLAEKRNPYAVQRKFEGLREGKYGYEKNLFVAIELEEEKNTRSIEGRIRDLENGGDSNQKIAGELNESLVKKENLEAIERKIVALSDGGVHPLPFRGYSALFNSVRVPTYGYKKDPVAARELNDLLIEKGNLQAIQRKIKSLLGKARGSYSNPEGSFEINLTYGYEKDPIAAREFIESLIVCDFPIARGIGKYIKAFAMKYGISQLGYEKDREKAFNFINENHVPY